MHSPTIRLRQGSAAIVLLAACLLLLVLSGTARAHAILEGGSVRDGEVLADAPDEVFLAFNERVSASQSGLRVFNFAGERVDRGGTFQPPGASDRVVVQLEEELPDGTYVATYRVTSADGHPVSGAMVFSIGEETGASDELVAQVFAADADRPWAIAAAIARGVMYLGSLLTAGVVTALWWLRRELDADGAEAGNAVRWLRRGAWASLVATAVGLVLQVVLVTGEGLASLADGRAVLATVTTWVGVSALLRLAGAAGLVVAARGRGPAGCWLLAMAGAVAGLGSLLLEGHTLTTGPAVVVWSSAAVHVVAGAVWLGGLVVLAVVLRAPRRADDPVGAGRVVARTSSLLAVAVIAVLVAGTALSWTQVREPRALVDTTYGLVMIAKVVAVLPVVALGAWNNRRLVPVLTPRRRRGASVGRPAITGGSDEPAESSRQRDQAWTALRRTVRGEIALITVVLAVTGVLVSLQPAAEAAGITGAYSETVEFEGIGQMTFTVDPNRAGRNEIHLYLLGDTGRLITDDVEAVTMRLVQPELDIGPIEREPILAGPGHYILAGPELSVAGPWQITTEVALDRFTVVDATVEVTVNP